MPMLDVQKRHAEVFRIRLGDKSETGAPRKLKDSVRITSHSREIVSAFTEVYGGDVQPWTSPKGAQFEAYLPTTWLAVLVLPGQSLTQWWELYAGATVQRRCDGFTEQLTGKPCMCPADIDVRVKTKGACRPSTRLSVVCPDVAVVGAGSLVTHGMIAAETLPQSIKVAEAALARGVMVPATLRIMRHEGKTHYVYPQLEIHGISLMELLPENSGAIAGRALGSGNGGVLAGPTASALPAPRVAPRQDRPEARAVTGSGPPLPPLPHEVAGEDGPPAVPDEPEVTSAVPLAPAPGGAADVPPQPVNRVAIAAREAGLDDDGRHDLAEWVSAGRTRSSALLDASEQAQAIDAARQIKGGTAALKRNGEGGLELRDPRFGWPAEDPVTGSANPDTVGDVAGLSADEIVAMKGPALMAALRERGLPLGGKVEEVRARLMEACGVTGDDAF